MLAFAARGTVAGHRLGALEGVWGGFPPPFPMHRPPPPPRVQKSHPSSPSKSSDRGSTNAAIGQKPALGPRVEGGP